MTEYVYTRSECATFRSNRKMMASSLYLEEKTQLQKWIGDGNKIFELMFSIKRDGCDSTTFHSLCDGKGPTMTVLYNTNDSVFGGYTSVPWESLGRYREDNNAFLFQLRHNGENKFSKFPHRDGEKAIYDGKDYGPYFGSGPDLLTFEKTVKKEEEYFPLNGKMKGHTYDMRGCEKINNGHMNVKDLEVYLVKDVPVTNWRDTETCWDQQTLTNLKTEIQNFTYPTTKITRANILLLGDISAGKSSFVNTIYSTFAGYYASVAISGSAERSVTRKFRRYPVWMDSKRLPFALCDTQGLDEVNPEEIVYIVDGNIPDGYQFNSTAPFKVDSQDSIKNPPLMEKIHCVVFVIDASRIDVMSIKIECKIKEFQQKLNHKEVPYVFLLTKVDKVCPLVHDDVSMIFNSKDISNVVFKTAELFGVPRVNVLPVKNYEDEQNVKSNVDILALIALRQIMRCSLAFLQMQSQLKEEKE